jgi:hypothetical protein
VIEAIHGQRDVLLLDATEGHFLWEELRFSGAINRTITARQRTMRNSRKLRLFLFLLRQQSCSDLLDVFNHFLDVADLVLCFAFGLVDQTLGLLRWVAHQFAGFFLDFPSDIFGSALNLIFVHIEFL